MSVLIRGMEMPKIGESVTIYPDGRVVRYDTYSGGTIRGKAIPVPPHGRLIDADALYKRFYAEELAMDKPYIDYLGLVVEAPTIISAGEGME